MEDISLEKIYYDAENPGSYGGVSRLSKAARVPLKTAQRWLSAQDAYTLHKPIRRKFQRRKVMAYGIGELLQCDLMDVSKLSKYNRGFKYILVAIDVFSKYGYAIPLKRKDAKSVLEGFQKLIKQVKVIRNLQTDQGKEFLNRVMKSFYKQHNIHHYYTHSETKASVAERFIRTLKEKLYRIFTHKKIPRYIDVLKSVLKSYNASKHRSTGYAPIDVTPDLEPEIFEKLYGYRAKPSFKFDIDDRVRISKTKRTFHKGYLPSWSYEIFTIYKRFPTYPPTYVLKDLKDEVVGGRFYEAELQKVTKTSRDFWKVEKILKTRGRAPNREYFIKWYGFDKRFNSWVKESWMQ